MSNDARTVLETMLNAKADNLPTDQVENAFLNFGAEVIPKACGEGLNISFDNGSLLTEVFFDVKDGENDPLVCCVPTSAHAKHVVARVLDSKLPEVV